LECSPHGREEKRTNESTASYKKRKTLEEDTPEISLGALEYRVRAGESLKAKIERPGSYFSPDDPLIPSSFLF